MIYIDYCTLNCYHLISSVCNALAYSCQCADGSSYDVDVDPWEGGLSIKLYMSVVMGYLHDE